MKPKRGIQVSDLSPACRALNPHLANLPGSTELAPGRSLVPSEAKSEAPMPLKVKEPKKMTRTEAEYEAILKRENPDSRILFERYTLKLSNDCRYTPDFAVIHPPTAWQNPDDEDDWAWMVRIEFHEVKGAFLFKGATKSSTHTSLTKPKLAAEQFREHRFYVAKKDENGSWNREQYKPAI